METIKTLLLAMEAAQVERAYIKGIGALGAYAEIRATGQVFFIPLTAFGCGVPQIIRQWNLQGKDAPLEINHIRQALGVTVILEVA